MIRLIKFVLIVGALYFLGTRLLADLPMVKDVRHIVEVVSRQNKER